jgi:hypothetical protein
MTAQGRPGGPPEAGHDVHHARGEVQLIDQLTYTQQRQRGFFGRLHGQGTRGSELQRLWPVHPLLAECDNTGEPLAWMLRRGSAGSNTAADHVALVDAAICALPPGFRRQLMITCDGAGASHDLVAHLDKLGTRRGHELTYSVGWALGEREKAALRLVPERA